MPGILPMKVIKVGTSSQARIAQACDRCRSKKIRCDGIRPSCTQCTSVGFECKTSDKLSRRAFPRGYTESLEERVRGLETETRELKDLLDAKDEKIDMLARMHSHSPHQSSSRRPSSVKSSPSLREAREALSADSDDHFKVKQLPYLHNAEISDPFFAATSSSRFFIESFRRKLQEAGKACPDFRIDVLLPSRPQRLVGTNPSQSQLWQAPPRVVSDQMVNIFFQEWAPLFPVLHRPTFLGLYEEYVASDGAVKDKKSLAQLNLVFSIAALSSESRLTYDVLACERQWVAALSTFSLETSIVNLQCLVLALIYCLQKGDHTKVLHYRSLAIGICQRLGLHQSQKRFAFGTLSSETRKKVFWTLYTIDCFTAATLGLPRLLKDEDVDCEYPVDADDEYVTEQGFQPSLPGESTKLSGALALFRGSRILSKILTQLYPSSSTHDITLSAICTLDEELQEWSDSLPSHLRLQFENDKPSTNIVSSRCPLLSLTYHYMRTMIHRPATCADIGSQASSSLNTLASSSKSIIQIIQLLDERRLSFSICMNKTELIMVSGFGTLFQILDLPQESRLRSEYQRVAGDVLKMLTARGYAGAIDFRQVVVCLLGNGGRETSMMQNPSLQSAAAAKQSLDARKALRDLARRYAAAATSSASPEAGPEASRSKATSSKVSSTQGSPDKRLRSIAPSSLRSEMRHIQVSHRSNSTQSPTTTEGSELRTNVVPASARALNLDYFSFGGDTPASPSVQSTQQMSLPPESLGVTWDRYLSPATSTVGQVSVSDSDIYGWPPLEDLLAQAGDGSFDKGTLDNSEWAVDTSWAAGAGAGRQHHAKSDFSLSEDTLSSGDEFASLDFASLDNEAAFRGLAVSSGAGTPDNVVLAPVV